MCTRIIIIDLDLGLPCTAELIIQYFELREFLSATQELLSDLDHTSPPVGTPVAHCETLLPVSCASNSATFSVSQVFGSNGRENLHVPVSYSVIVGSNCPYLAEKCR